MRRASWLALTLVFLAGLCATVAVQAQTTPPVSVGDNANIIPIYKSSEPPTGDDYLRGNLLGQRCNEPSIGVFENNPQTMMVFCNDYRATFNWDDAIVPAGRTSLVAAAWSAVKTFMARATGRPAPQRGTPRIIASAEAGIGGGISYDGGTTWQGFMVPGGPHDNTPASLAHPGKALNLQGYSDPWVINLGNDTIGLAYIGFTRDKVTGQSNTSGIFFTRYRNRNNSDTVHNIEYVGTSAVAISNNLAEGQFLDKVGGTRGADGRIYITFTRFTGSKGSSNIFLARSVDGVNWVSEAIDTNSKYGQGTVALANPDPAKAGVVGVLWRTFGTNSLVYRRYGKGTKNIDLFAGDPQGPYLPFDQYAQAISSTDPNRVAFRALAFPAATYTPDGSKILVLFTEWIDLNTGRPGTSGNPKPMIVMKVGSPDGASWSKRYVLNWSNGEHGSVPPSPDQLGFFNTLTPEGTRRSVGAQFMPAVACNGAQCLVIWKQDFSSQLSTGGPENSSKPVMSGLGRRFDVRGALVTLGGAEPGLSASFQASRYGYKDLAGTDRPGDISDSGDWIATMVLPNGTTYPLVHWGNRSHTGGGLLAFVGDYLSVAAVPGEPPGRPGFMVAFADNRYNIWPWQTADGNLVPKGQEWAYYPVFMAPNDPENKIPGVSCVNYGSRVQSVMAARVSTLPLLLTAQTNHKDFCATAGGACPAATPVACGGSLGPGGWVPSEQCVEFPVSVRNNTNGPQSVSLELTGTSTCGSAGNEPCFSFAKRPYNAALDGVDTCGATGNTPCSYPYKLTTGTVEIFPYSSYSLNVYAFNGNPVTLKATGAGSVAELVLNGPGAVTSGDPAFAYVPSKVTIESGSARSGSARSGSARSGSARSGSARSYPVPDDPVPGQTVYDVIDYTYVVTPSSTDDAGSYLSLFNIDPAYEGSYVFQVFVTKPLTSFMTDKDDSCTAFNWTEGALVGHISDPSNPLVGSARSGSARSGSARSGSARSAIPFDGDPLVHNTSFTLGSSTSLTTAQSGAVATTSATAAGSAGLGCRVDECSLAAPRFPNEVTILVRAYQITQDPDAIYDPDGSRTGIPTPPSVAAAEYSCDDPSCTAALGPDLVVQTDPMPSPSVTPTTVPAGGQVTFPTVTVNNEGTPGQCGTETVPRPCGGARAHEWAVYASTEQDFEKVPRWNCAVDDCATEKHISGTVKVNGDPTEGPVTVQLAAGSHAEVSVGEMETTPVGTLTIPLDIARPNDGQGTYWLHFYDDRGRLVNELDETNNDWTEGPITVVAPAYQSLGLQSPCSGFTCDKTGTLPLAWQFTRGSVPVDSVANLPRLKFWAGCSLPIYPIGSPAAVSEPNPADLTSGQSGWQYFPYAGMVRPQYTWQFNFDATGLPRGTCYTMWIEIPSTSQVVPPTDPTLAPLGPFLITPR